MPPPALRPMTRADHVAVWELHRRAQRHDRVPQVVEYQELVDELDDGTRVYDTDTRVAELAGAVAGYAYTLHLPVDDAVDSDGPTAQIQEDRCYVIGAVDPTWRGHGVGRALMAWGIARATEQLRAGGRERPRVIRADAFEFVTDAQRLFARMGMRPVRYTDELLRPLEPLPPLAAVDGVRIVPWPDDRDDDIRRAKNAAFTDHWGSSPTSPERWQQLVRGFGARPDLSFVALDGDDRVVAHCLNHRYEADDALLGRRDGWIQNLGTIAAWRGRGIASALVARSLHAFAAAGLTHASIGVDSENPSGAARLYRSLGFEPVHRIVVHQLDVA